MFLDVVKSNSVVSGLWLRAIRCFRSTVKCVPVLQVAGSGVPVFQVQCGPVFILIQFRMIGELGYVKVLFRITI